MIGGQAFTTGKIKRSSIEKVLPNTMVEFKLKNGAGCDWSHYLPAEMEGRIVPDEHIHEHATCFNLKDKGLIVISSCGHVGIVNSVRQAMEVSGVSKVHAIMGGFHLGSAPADYLTQVVAEIGKLSPDVLIPMHCSGLNFTQEAQRQMPGKVLTTTTGTRISPLAICFGKSVPFPDQVGKAMPGSRAGAWLVIASLFGGGVLSCHGAAAEEQPSAEQMMDDLMFGNGTVGGPFTLTDQTGRTRSDREFRGKLMIVYFGYTFCPDVCPADLMAITQALDALGGAADDIQPVFITVDPERDTKVLSDYVAAFHPQPDRPDRLAGAEFERSPMPTRRFTRKCRASEQASIRSTIPASSI